ncbi:Uncharacterised protein [Collinsella intestinalis]|nr:Uncharacterised protein [Collinsella intestinalis]
MSSAGVMRSMPLARKRDSMASRDAEALENSPGSSENTAATCSEGVMPLLLSRGWRLRVARLESPPMRTMRNSRMLLSKMAMNFRRSNSGTDSSIDSASTRSSNRSQESSRFWV